jgi:hypothetical protein
MKISEQQQNGLIKIGAGIAIYFLVVKPILEKIGLKKTKQEDEADKKAKEAEDRKNAPQPIEGWQLKDFNAWQPQSINNLNQYCDVLNKTENVRKGYYTVPLFTSLPKRLAETIKDTDGFFVSAKQAWNITESAIKECTSKLAVCYLVKVFKSNYNLDLKSYLDDSARNYHFFDNSKEILASINAYVDNLPTGLYFRDQIKNTLELKK